MTLQDIAKQFNTSISTVSRSLNAPYHVKNSLRYKIKEYALEMGFMPNLVATNLRKKQTNIIGVIVPFISNNFYESFLACLDEICQKENYYMMVLQSLNDINKEWLNITMFKRLNVSALFICLANNSHNYSKMSALFASQFPVIYFDKVPNTNQVFKIESSDRIATELALNQLFKKRPRYIVGIFGNDNTSIVRNRLVSFYDFIKTKSLQGKGIQVNCEEDCKRQLQQLFFFNKDTPNAIFCMSDELLIWTMKFIQRSQLKYPKEVDIISLSNGIIPNYFFPEIEYVLTSGNEMASLCYAFFKDIKNDLVNKNGEARSIKPKYFKKNLR
ncbi:MAG: LacI family DNA-binding transcriptional regulator [Alphaproteobacteria bacterium]|nr:LacI family DNA-binding transcriptional regulator [Alphaproteobacteria bacterium]